jgi:hypothetical protein
MTMTEMNLIDYGFEELSEQELFAVDGGWTPWETVQQVQGWYNTNYAQIYEGTKGAVYTAGGTAIGGGSPWQVLLAFAFGFAVGYYS